MNSFWDLNKKDNAQQTQQKQEQILSEYQERKAAEEDAVNNASRKLTPSQVESEPPQITVNFTSNDSTQTVQQNTSASYNITKAAADTTIPEIVISSKINNTIHKEAPLLDPNATFTGPMDLSQLNANMSKSGNNMQISSPEKQFTIPSSPFISNVDTSLFNITPDMTSTNKMISNPKITTNNKNTAPLLKANTNNLRLTDPALYNITSDMTPTHTNTSMQVQKPNTNVPLAQAGNENSNFTITNALSMPNPSISKTSQQMSPTNTNGINAQNIQSNINNQMTLSDIHKNTVNADPNVGTNAKNIFYPKSILKNNAVNPLGGMLQSVANSVFSNGNQEQSVDTTSVDFAKDLGNSLSSSKFLKDLKSLNYSYANGKEPIAFNSAIISSMFKNSNGLQDFKRKAATDAMNSLLGINASADDYYDFFSKKVKTSGTEKISQAIKMLNTNKIKMWKKSTKTGNNLSRYDGAYNAFVAAVTNNQEKKNDSIGNLANEIIKQKIDDATKIIKDLLSKQGVSQKFILQLIAGGADDNLSGETFSLRNDLNSIAVYMLLFGAGKTHNAMSTIISECSKNDSSADHVFGSLPHAMSEIYETMVAGDEATIEKLRQSMVNNVNDHGNQFHILTSMDIALPEVQALNKIASEGNKNNAFAMMQSITGATTRPFNATKGSKINSDPTLKKIISGIKTIKESNGNSQIISQEESTLQKALTSASNNAASYSSMLRATNITPKRQFLYESVTDKGLFKEKINFAYDNIKDNRLTVDNLTPYVSVAFFKDNNWLVSRAPTMFMYAAVISADIEKDRDSPSATAVIAMSNTTGVLSDFTVNQYTTKYSSGTKNANLIGIFVEPGMNIQVRIGHTPYFSKMDVVFNGFVDEVQAGETLIVTASSFGAELLKPAYQGNEHLGTLYYANPRDMVVNALSHIKSYHLGARSYFDWIFYNRKQDQTLVDTWLDRVPILSLVPDAYAQDPKYFQNIFAPDMYWGSGSLTTAAEAGKFLDHVSMYFSRYTTTAGETAWKVIQDAANRMPGFIATVRNADERQTVFFGRPEYPYRYTYHPSLYAASNGNDITSMYNKSILAEASKDKIKRIYNDFNKYYTDSLENYTKSFSKYQIEQSGGTQKSIANNFMSAILSGKRNVNCILSGRCLLVNDSRFSPLSIVSNSSSAAVKKQVSFLTNRIDSIANDTKQKIIDVAGKDKNSIDACNAVDKMASLVKTIYVKNLKSASSAFIGLKNDVLLDPSVVANLLIAFNGKILSYFVLSTDEISNAMYNIARGVDFHTRMMHSKEMYKMVKGKALPDTKNGIPWQLIPYTGKIPATIDGSTMLRRYWIAHSSINLIENDVHTDPSSIATSITCFGKSVYSGWDWSTLLISRILKFVMTGQNSLNIPEEVATINNNKMYGFKVSANKYIIPEDRRDEVYVDANANMPQVRAFVAASVLADKMSRGYNGSFVITGNHMIEPYDSVLLDDEESNMHGLVDVRKVMIHLSRQTGLVTRVIPDMKVGIRNLTISPATRFVGTLMSIALFTLETVGVAATMIGTGGLALPIGAAVAFGINGTVKKMIHMFLPPMSFSNSNSFVRDTSLDAAGGTVKENGITKNGVIEWKFDNALTLYPLFIGDSYYLPRMRGYNYRDRAYWDDVKKGWNRYWAEVNYGFSNSLKYLRLTLNSDTSMVKNAISELESSQNFDSGFLNTAKNAANEIGGN